MMILQGVGHPVPYLGVLYANDPKKGGYMAYAPALDLTTLFEVIWPKMHVAPGNRDLLPFWAVFGLKTLPGGGRSGV